MALYTASLASGYLTNPMYDVAVGPFRCFVSHYETPDNASGHVDPGMNSIIFAYMQDADMSACAFGTNSVGGVTFHFSGQAAGDTGWIFILGF